MKIFSIGECMAELSCIKDDKYKLSFAGDTANTAIYLSRLGAKTSYITSVGNDNLSNKMIKYLKNEKVLTNNILINEKKTLGLYLIQNDLKGEREFFYWRSESAAKTLFDNINIADYAKKFLNYDAIYFSGITLSIYNNKNINKLYLLIKILKKNNIKICIDLNIRSKNWQNILEANKIIKKFTLLCDIVFASNEDLSYLKAKNIDDFISKYIYKSLVIYRHGDGLVKIFEDNKIIKYNLKFKQKIIDATGCGDAFNAAFLISYFNKKNLENCVRSAHKLGKKVALTKGAIIKR